MVGSLLLTAEVLDTPPDSGMGIRALCGSLLLCLALFGSLALMKRPPSVRRPSVYVPLAFAALGGCAALLSHLL